MAICKRFFPPAREILNVFAIIVFPVYSWAIVWSLWRLDSWEKILSVGEILLVFAYTLAFALVESLLALFMILLLNIVVPGRYLRDVFVPQAGAIVIVLVCWGLAVQLSQYQSSDWTIAEWMQAIVLLGMALVIFFLLAYRLELIAKLIRSLAERVSVLLFFYLPLSLLSFTVVIGQNVVFWIDKWFTVR